jgi:hypothetical protein
MLKIEWQVAVESDEDKITMEIKCRVDGAAANGNALAELLKPATLTDAVKAAIQTRLEELEREATARRGSLN